jgi:NADH-quinone oxidoreductase subunit L
MTRQVWLVFFGEKRLPVAVHPHESPVAMWLPMALLSALSLFFWFSINPFNAEGWFLHWIGKEHGAHLVWVPFVASAVTFLSIFLAYRQTKSENPFQVNNPIPVPDNIQSRWSWLRGYSNEQYFLIPFDLSRSTLKLSKKMSSTASSILLRKEAWCSDTFIGWVDRMFVDGGVTPDRFSIRSAGTRCPQFAKRPDTVVLHCDCNGRLFIDIVAGYNVTQPAPLKLMLDD